MISREKWTPADGMDLEPSALLAVREETANVVVTAGPGAGKTELLAQRADFLLRTGGCRYPRRILAISFKVDAARNIQERVRKRCGTELAARFDSFTFHAFAKRIIDNYRILLTGNKRLDPDYTLDTHDRILHKQITYDDLVPFAIEILQKSPQARNAIRQTYTHVFLDEFQDAKANQYALLKEIFLDTGAILTAVGDVKQRIMRFAGALDGIMKTFADDYAAQPLTLYQNFRSAPRLRRMQNRMVQVMDPPAAVSMDLLAGDEGVIRSLPFTSVQDEANDIATRIEGWLDEGVPPNEIAVLVRQQPHLVCGQLIAELRSRAISCRNDHVHQDLTTEPAAVTVLNVIRVIADDGRSTAYESLMRIVSRSSLAEETELRNARAISRFLASKRTQFREGAVERSDPEAWKNLVAEFVELVTLPVMRALSAEYQRGNRVDQVIGEATNAFLTELERDGDPRKSLTRLSEEDAVRIINIHKCKGLEFERVVVFGVEEELFWADSVEDNRAEFFVAISRAKKELVLTWTTFRPRPTGAVGRWSTKRHPQAEFLGYALEQ